MAGKLIKDNYEDKWRADEDVSAIQRVGEISSDPKRQKLAAAAAATKLKEMETKRKALEAVVNKGLKKAFPNKK